MVPFFVRYIIQPEDPDRVLAIALGFLFVSSALATPFWKWLSTRIGRRNAWLTYNAFNAVSNILFFFVGEGDVTLFYIVAAINGFPVGGQFLIDAILSDVIDYDELLNGTRNEASFTVFATFIPKIISVPASAIPLSIISAAGFRATVDGQTQPQTDTVKNVIRVIFVIIPSVAMLASYLVKLRYPLRTDEQVQQIAEGIAMHQEGHPCYDPVVGKNGITILKLDEEEQRLAFLLDNFSWKTLQGFRKSGGRSPRHMLLEVRLLALLGFASFAGFIIVIVFTFELLDNDALAWVPAFSAIMTGVSLCFGGVNFLRMQAAQELEGVEVPLELVERIIAHKMRGQRGGDLVTREEYVDALPDLRREDDRVRSEYSFGDDRDVDEETIETAKTLADSGNV